MVTSVDDAVKVKVRSLFLDGFDSAPKYSLSATTIVGVGMKEPHGSLSVSSDMDTYLIMSAETERAVIRPHITNAIAINSVFGAQNMPNGRY